MHTFQLGQRVIVQTLPGNAKQGVVCGFGFQTYRSDDCHPVILVALDEGQYLSDGKTFVSSIVCHYDNVKPERF